MNVYTSNIFLKLNIDGIFFSQIELAYIHDTKHPFRDNLVKFCHDVHYIWRGN